MTYGDNVTHQLFQDGLRNELEFPNQVSARINPRGLLDQLSYPGLAAKSFVYDADGRPTRVMEGAFVSHLTEWKQGRLASVRVAPPPSEEDALVLAEFYYPDYDTAGRVIRLKRSQTMQAPITGGGGGPVSKDDPSEGGTSPDREIVGTVSAVEEFSYDTEIPTRLTSYTDGNGVPQTYTYKDNRLTGINIADQIELVYQYDTGGNLTEVTVADMNVTYNDWAGGYPGTMTWGDGASFSVTTDDTGRLTDITSEALDLKLALTYSESPVEDACDSTTAPTQATITRVVRGGPTLSETLTPTYAEKRLQQVSVERRVGPGANQPLPEPESGQEPPEPSYQTKTFTETYGITEQDLLNQVSLVLTEQIGAGANTPRQLALRQRSMRPEAGPRQAQVTSYKPKSLTAATPEETVPAWEVDNDQTMAYEENSGNLVGSLNTKPNTNRRFTWDGNRRLRELSIDGQVYAYDYDSRGRRIRATKEGSQTAFVFVYQGSKLIAVGVEKEPTSSESSPPEQNQDATATIEWTHVIAHGPFGPAFIRSLENPSESYYIFNDHLGTPFAYKQVNTTNIFYTPMSPYGESWWNSFDLLGGEKVDAMAEGFALPTFGERLTKPFLGLSGHMRDADTGLTYMHHRYYDPQLGHFLNPDFRAPDIYDPSTFTEPYAYAAGNPIMFWDPNGLETISNILTEVAADLQHEGGFFEQVVAHKLMATNVLFVFIGGSVDKVIDAHTTGDTNISNWDYGFALLEIIPFMKLAKVTKIFSFSDDLLRHSDDIAKGSNTVIDLVFNPKTGAWEFPKVYNPLPLSSGIGDAGRLLGIGPGASESALSTASTVGIYSRTVSSPWKFSGGHPRYEMVADSNLFIMKLPGATRPLFDQILDNGNFKIFVDQVVFTEALEQATLSYHDQLTRFMMNFRIEVTDLKRVALGTAHAPRKTTPKGLKKVVFTRKFDRMDFVVAYSAMKLGRPLVTANANLPNQIFENIVTREFFKDLQYLTPKTSIHNAKVAGRLNATNNAMGNINIFSTLEDLKKILDKLSKPKKIQE